MANLVLIFATGLTTGGLSCLAVQGGMLASSLGGNTEASVKRPAGAVRGQGFEQELGQLKQRGLSKKIYAAALKQLKHRYPLQEAESYQAKQHAPARPIVLFLAAKLLAYSLLGLALGWLGSVLQLTPIMRATLQIAIGLFMLGTALRLLNVHPIFRYFVIEPPKFIARYIRRKTKQADDNWLAPTFLGALTVLIPCGITQAMMALAVASGNPLTGALILFAFVLGTTPLFFTLAYLATRLGARWQAKFWKITGAVVLILGLVAVNGGLTLLGSPLTLASIRQSIATRLSQAGGHATADQSGRPAATAASANNELTMDITDQSYSPAEMEAKAGQPIKLTVNTHNVRGCAGSLVIPSLNTQKMLGQDDSQAILIPPQLAGSTVRLTCVMGMYNAQIAIK